MAGNTNDEYREIVVWSMLFISSCEQLALSGNHNVSGLSFAIPLKHPPDNHHICCNVRPANTAAVKK